MKKLTAATAATMLAVLSNPAQAEDMAGSFQAKLLGTAVLPDGKIDRINVVDTSTTLGAAAAGLMSPLQTKANDNYVPTVAIEYFVTNNISIETICCLTQHDVDGTTGLPGAELVADAKLIPATITAKVHFDVGGVKPYIGAGPAYFMFIDDEPGAATVPLGITDFTLSDEFGLALQAGVDIPVNDKGLGVSIDAKRYFVDTTARWFEGNTVAVETVHKLDPWVVSAGLSYRF